MDRILLSENEEGHKLVSNGAVMDRTGEKGGEISADGLRASVMKPHQRAKCMYRS